MTGEHPNTREALTTETVTMREIEPFVIDDLELDFRFDRDGDLEISIDDRYCRECNGRTRYLTQERARALAAWLNQALGVSP